MTLGGAACLHSLDRHCEPLHQIKCVDCLIFQCAAALLVQGTAPIRFGVVFGVTVPEHGPPCPQNLAHPARIHQAAHIPGRIVVTVLEADAKRPARAVADFDHLFGIGGIQRHWLFAKHMLTMLHGFYGNLRVQIVGQADVYNIDFRVIQYPVILCLRVWDAVGFCGGRANITGDNTLGVLDIFQGLEMIFGDHTTADNCRFKCIHWLFLPFCCATPYIE